MKRTDLIRELESHGWTLQRNGANHDIYVKGKMVEPIPRHKEIRENLAMKILKRAGLR